MTTPATTPRTRRKRIAAIVTATLTAIAVALYATDTRTDIVESAVKVPAQLDASTPARQGGFELVKIERGQKGGTKLRVACLYDPQEPATADSWFGRFTASGKSSLGSTFPLGYPTPDYDRKLRSGTERPISLTIYVPGSYPNTYQWIDVRLESTDGHNAVWRIGRLPRTHRAIHAGATENTVATGSGGIQLIGSAVLVDKDVMCDFSFAHANAKMPIGESWQFTPFLSRGHTDWVTTDFEFSQLSSRLFEYDEQPTYRYVSGKTVPGIIVWAYGVYPESRFARCTGELQRVVDFDEYLTFDNVPIRYEGESKGSRHYDVYVMDPASPITKETPSGIEVKVLPPGDMMKSVGCLNARISTSPGSGLSQSYAMAPSVRLARSPIFKKYHSDAQISVEPVGYTHGGGSPGGMRAWSLNGTESRVSRVAKITLRIRQHSIVERIPVSFTFDISKLQVQHVRPLHQNKKPAPPKATRTP
ncbi:MAG TPA: hypothetical protein VGK19_22770 [Capsulimonadaceae bacterium]|jgi:hypothetical protein